MINCNTENCCFFNFKFKDIKQTVNPFSFTSTKYTNWGTCKGLPTNPDLPLKMHIILEYDIYIFKRFAFLTVKSINKITPVSSCQMHYKWRRCLLEKYKICSIRQFFKTKKNWKSNKWSRCRLPFSFGHWDVYRWTFK